MVLVVKNPRANAGDTRDVCSIPGLGRSPGDLESIPTLSVTGESPWTKEADGL